jgi:hypothetical protein
MSEPAKDEAELIERMAEGLHDHHDLNIPEKYRGSFRTVRPPESCTIIVGTVTAVLAAIRAAGWAVVPANLTLPMMAAGGPVMRAACGLDEKSATMNTINDVWRAMLAAAPGVKP